MESFKAKSAYVFNSLFIKSLVLFSLSAAAIAAPATEAASTPSKELFSLTRPVNFRWAGPYVGAYIGGAWGNADLSTSAGSVTNTSYFTSTADINSVASNGSQTLYPSSFIGGLQVGDNWVYKNYVYGFVLNYGAMNFSDQKAVQNSAYPSGSGNYSINTSISTNWMYTIRGRFGWLPELYWPMMVYGTGGLAVTKLQVSNQFSDSTSLAGAGSGNNNNTVNGWCLGFGIEVPLTQNLTINGEYLYTDFGSVKVQSTVYNSVGGFGINTNSLVNPFSTSARLYANTFNVGINYKFNSDVSS